MDKGEIFTEDLRCEEACVYNWVDCMDAEDGASICKTWERNCFDECTHH